MIKFLFIFLFSSLVLASMPEPPINYLMDGKYAWRIDGPNGIPGKAILYYDLPPYFDGIPDLVLAFNVYSINRKNCIKKNYMTPKYIYLNAGCGTDNAMVYTLSRPNYAARAFRDCEIIGFCKGWFFIKEK